MSLLISANYKIESILELVALILALITLILNFVVMSKTKDKLRDIANWMMYALIIYAITKLTRIIEIINPSFIFRIIPRILGILLVVSFMIMLHKLNKAFKWVINKK